MINVCHALRDAYLQTVTIDVGPDDTSRHAVAAQGTPDEQWDNNTCVTGVCLHAHMCTCAGATSDPSYSCEDLRQIKHLKYAQTLFGGGPMDGGGGGKESRMRCARYTWL